jgi:hypothetical protein
MIIASASPAIARNATPSGRRVLKRPRAESFTPHANVDPSIAALRSRPSWPQVHHGNTTNTLSRAPLRARILFYHKNDPYYGFTNFSPHPVIYKGKRYPTSEHLFQSFKVSSGPVPV